MVKEVQEGEKKEKGGNRVVYAGIVIVILLLVVIAVLLLGKKSGGDTGNSADSASRRNAVINESNIEEVVSSMAAQEPVALGSYRASMNSTWQFADGKSASENAYVENVEANTNDVYFDVVLPDTEETIYSSPLIPRGSYLDEITLDKELPAGTYDCTLTYHLVDEEQETVGLLNMGVTIVIDQ